MLLVPWKTHRSAISASAPPPMSPSYRRQTTATEQRYRRPERLRGRAPRWTKKWFGVAAASAAFALLSLTAIAPPPAPTQDQVLTAYLAEHQQTLVVASGAKTLDVARSTYSATGSYETLATGGTNYDFAELVMMYGGWPTSSINITVMLRWMRQENGPPNWFNRNNPLNNGYGSGGNAGTGSFDNLMIAAQKVAENLKRYPGFAPIASAFAASTSTKSIEHAIWASPWATSHYANGTHWAYTPVPIVKAPDDAWD
jgi:hypothetical protein